MKITHFQNQLLELVEWINLFLGGGKGGGKSFALMLLCFQHCEKYGAKAHALVLRRAFADLEELRRIGLGILADMYPDVDAARMWNGTRFEFSLPGGGIVQLGYLDSYDDHLRYRGSNVSMLAVDELGAMDPKLFELIRAELRAPKGMRTRIVCSSNPGLKAHDYLRKNYASHKPWQPFVEEHTGLMWMNCPSTVYDNPTLDPASQVQGIMAQARTDPENAEALITGDWDAIATSAFFNASWDERRSVIREWDHLPDHSWRYELSIDHGGGASVSTFLLCATALETALCANGTLFPRHSIVVFDEYDDSLGRETGNWNETYGTVISTNCEQASRLCRSYGMKAQGVIDPQVEQNHGDPDRLIDLYRDSGVQVRGWNGKKRAPKAAIVRQMMYDAQIPDERERPGLYFTTRAEGCIATIPRLPRDRTNPDCPETRNVADHHYDAVAGIVFHRHHEWSRTELRRAVG